MCARMQWKVPVPCFPHLLTIPLRLSILLPYTFHFCRTRFGGRQPRTKQKKVRRNIATLGRAPLARSGIGSGATAHQDQNNGYSRASGAVPVQPYPTQHIPNTTYPIQPPYNTTLLAVLGQPSIYKYGCVAHLARGGREGQRAAGMHRWLQHWSKSAARKTDVAPSMLSWAVGLQQQLLDCPSYHDASPSQVPQRKFQTALLRPV